MDMIAGGSLNQNSRKMDSEIRNRNLKEGKYLSLTESNVHFNVHIGGSYSMTTINITNLRKELFKTVSSCLKYSDVVTISTKEGNVVMMSEEDYRSLLESLAIATTPGLIESIKEGVATPIEECEKVEWK